MKVSRESTQLRSRWSEEPWQSRLSRVTKAMRRGESLTSLHLEKADGYIDLRGVRIQALTPTRTPTHTVSPVPKDVKLQFVEDRLIVKDWNLELVDFSYSDLSGIGWRASRFKDVKFRQAVMPGSGMVNCRFDNVDFGGADLRGSVLGGCLAPGFSEYLGCSFERADLRETVYQYPVFQDCTFFHANLDDVDFGWSRLLRCKFVGRIRGASFHGSFSWAPRREQEPLLSRGVSPVSVVNPMEAVDFSAAYLDDVTFSEGISLETCIFPLDKDLIVIRDRERTYRMMETTIRSRWQDPARTEALEFLELFSSDKGKAGQKMDVVNRCSYEPMISAERPWAAEFFDLLAQAAAST